MLIGPVEFERVIQALNESGVRYVIVGGVAVVLHGVDRLTADLDVVIDLEGRACLAALEALEALGYRPRVPVAMADFADPDKRQEWNELRNMQVFSLWEPANELPVLDLFVRYPGDFEKLLDHAVNMDLGEVTATVVSIDDLIAIKTAAGRDKDLKDVERLNALRR